MILNSGLVVYIHVLVLTEVNNLNTAVILPVVQHSCDSLVSDKHPLEVVSIMTGVSLLWLPLCMMTDDSSQTCDHEYVINNRKSCHMSCVLFWFLSVNVGLKIKFLIHKSFNELDSPAQGHYLQKNRDWENKRTDFIEQIILRIKIWKFKKKKKKGGNWNWTQSFLKTCLSGHKLPNSSNWSEFNWKVKNITPDIMSQYGDSSGVLSHLQEHWDCVTKEIILHPKWFILGIKEILSIKEPSFLPKSFYNPMVNPLTSNNGNRRWMLFMEKVTAITQLQMDIFMDIWPLTMSKTKSLFFFSVGLV